MVTASPGSRDVSSPRRSRMWSLLTKRLMCRRTAPVSSQMFRWRAGYRRSSSSSTPRRFVAASASCDALAQQARKGVGTWTMTVGAWHSAFSGPNPAHLDPANFESACISSDSALHEPRSSGRESAPSGAREKSEPTHVGCYGSRVLRANFGWENSLPGDMEIGSLEAS